MIKKMKLSLYNENIQNGNDYFIYNLYHNSLICISTELMDKLKNLEFKNIESSILDQLINNGFVLNDNQDELEYIKYEHNRVKYDNTQCSYMIYPTLTCNLDCSYCFEKVDRKMMKKDQLAILKKFLISQAENPRRSYMHIRWTGGEPLLLWKHVKDITNQVSEACKNNNVTFSSSLYTNATLISEKIAEEIYKVGFSRITISIDGPKEIHDKRRYFKNNIGSFHDVINGINNISRYQKIILRINLDKINVEYYENFLIELDSILKFKSNVVIYMKPVMPAFDCTLDETMYDDIEFSKVENTLIEVTRKHNFNLEIHPGFDHATRCIAYQLESYVIDPELQLFKCPIHIGRKEERVGIINEDSKKIIEKSYECIKYINSSPFDLEECKKCKVLPLCFGKCPVKWKQLNYGESQACIPEKESLISKIKHFIIPDYLHDI